MGHVDILTMIKLAALAKLLQVAFLSYTSISNALSIAEANLAK